MKRKTFRLQKVLEIREIIEKKHQKELALAKQNIQVQHKELDRVLIKKKSFIRTMLKNERPNASEMLRSYDYLTAVTQDIHHRNCTIKNLKEEADKKRKKLLQATRDKKILENLREKILRQIETEENKKEQIELDEIATRKSYSLLK
jgi:flagellar FliJ protein